jgi:hypothetical protein
MNDDKRIDGQLIAQYNIMMAGKSVTPDDYIDTPDIVLEFAISGVLRYTNESPLES